MSLRSAHGGENALISELLRYDLREFASKINYVPTPAPLRAEDVAALLNLAEQYSRSNSDENWNKALVICGLLWEHRRVEWQALPGFILQLLSRMGLGPSMQMVDSEFDRGEDRYSSLGSILLESAVAARTYSHEVRVAGEHPLLLSKFQKDVWSGIDAHPRLGISAPTSAGKSFVLASKIIDLLSASIGTVIYIVPTLSLIQQVTRDIRQLSERFGIDGIHVMQTYTPKADPEQQKLVYVLTQERAHSAMMQSPEFGQVEMLVVDEVQNVERVADEPEERSRTLFEVIQEMEIARHPRRAVISGPRLENIAQLTRSLFGPDAVAIPESVPPVASITYTFAKKRGKHFIRLYSVANAEPIEEAIEEPGLKAIIGKSQYRDTALDFLSLVAESVTTDHGTLVFSPNPRQATLTARGLADRRSSREVTAYLQSLADYAAETVHENYGIIDCIPVGVGYHHGVMPQHLRIAVEDAFTGGELQLLACTTTLMQGVNLPAKNIIARNPDLYVKKHDHATKLTPYEFANLRGRAGRLLKDFVGRAIILDEDAFEDTDLGGQLPGKTVKSGYADRFNKHRTTIERELLNGDSIQTETGANDLVAYIRQMILKYGQTALRRFERVGITISDQEYSTTQRQLTKLRVPREICERAPYWDPMILDELYEANERGELASIPSTPYADDFVNRLVMIVEQLREVVPLYFQKYLGSANENFVRSLAVSARGWALEDSLKEIILWNQPPFLHDWEEIDRRLQRLSSKVLYDLPKLLRPLVQMQDPDNPLLSWIELGAYRPATRRLIEFGLPRETATRIVRRAPDSLAEVPNDNALIRRATAIGDAMTHWERRQIRDVLGSPSVVRG